MHLPGLDTPYNQLLTEGGKPMPEQPELYLKSDEKAEPIPLCPFRHTMLPGPLAHQISFHDVPCLHDKCAVYDAVQGRCSLPSIAHYLFLIASKG